MTTVAIQLPFDDAMQLYRATLAQFYREQARRDRLGLERLVYLPSLMSFEQILRLTSEQVQTITHEIEHELWEHAWGEFSEEWAWHRAEQEVQSTLGTAATTLTKDELETLIEKRVEQQFERYVSEIDFDSRKEDEVKKSS
ncbi:MAG: hypothetical protein H6759_01475 [Candidatus Nomurabacteria bacterium]|nr:hypothetical protein [Candidatus Magasanikbacteria bacterium]USN52727.1 MAG: hypothetical protein H6759_01475 [Candidatus Nomurabacteria bacterium]